MSSEAYQPYEPSKYFTDVAIGFFQLFVTLTGIIYFWTDWILLPWAILYGYALQGLGITLAYHRGLTHRAFDFRYQWMERVFVTLGCMAMQRGPLYWTSLHRHHHKYSDTPQDPHDRSKGFWYAHLFWPNHVDPRYRAFRDPRLFSENVRDIAKDPYYLWLDKYYFVPWLVSLLVLYAIGGWPYVIYLGFFSGVYILHVTFFVNSVNHSNGYRTFEGSATGDASTNNWWVAWLAMGEGWHNNHHAFPSSPKHGFFKWWELDFTYGVILLLEKIGLVENLKRVSPQQIESALPAKLDMISALHR